MTFTPPIGYDCCEGVASCFKPVETTDLYGEHYRSMVETHFKFNAQMIKGKT